VHRATRPSMNEPKRVTAAILRKDGKILIAKRQRGDAFEGKWEFPGGKIEDGETPEQCLKRELFEEIGIDTIVQKLLCIVSYSYAEGSILLYAYEVAHSKSDFELKVHEEVKWAEPCDLGMYDFLEADKLIIEKLVGGTNSGF
jgi:8-oxo-dGTP diphosphatase